MLDKHTILWTLLLSLLFVTAGIAQNHEVSGTVTDAETGETLPGVNIAVQGTTQGTTSDNEILICFTVADHDYTVKSGHTYDVSTSRNMFARSLDGGETWTIEDAYE